MAMELIGWHWRDNMRPARFFMFDARAALMVVMLLVHPRYYTVAFFLAALVVFNILERMGLTFEAALRRLRSSVCGTERPGVIWTARRRLVDLGGNQ